MQTPECLNTPVANMNVSEKFKSTSIKLGITYLKQVFEKDIREIKAHPEFTYLWYTELLAFLKEEDLLDTFTAKLSD